MNVAARVFEAVFIMIFPIEKLLFFGKLHIDELELYRIYMILTTTITGCIAGVRILFLLTLLRACIPG